MEARLIFALQWLMEWEFVYNFIEMWSVREFSVVSGWSRDSCANRTWGDGELRSWSSSSNKELVVAHKGKIRSIGETPSVDAGQDRPPHIKGPLFYTWFRCNLTGTTTIPLLLRRSMGFILSHPNLIQVTCVNYVTFTIQGGEERNKRSDQKHALLLFSASSITPQGS